MPLPVARDLVVRFRDSKVEILDEVCKGCRICEWICPCQVLAPAGKFNKQAYIPTFAVRESSCIGCKLCEAVCPDFAIYITHVDRRELIEES